MMIPGFGEKIKHLRALFWEYEKELFTGLLVVSIGFLGYGLGRYSLLPEKPPVRILQAATSTPAAIGSVTTSPVGQQGNMVQQKQTSTQAAPSDIYFVGTRTTKKFRRSDCPGISQIAEKNRVMFKTKEDALAARYVPVKNCPGM